MIRFQSHDDVSPPSCVLRVLLATYVDPGSGSYYFQIVIAGVTTVFYFLSSIKRKFLSIFMKLRGSHGPAPASLAAAALWTSKTKVTNEFRRERANERPFAWVTSVSLKDLVGQIASARKSPFIREHKHKWSWDRSQIMESLGVTVLGVLLLIGLFILIH